MGKRGPRPTPTRLLQLRGSKLVIKDRREREVKGPEGLADKPDWLDEMGQKAWDFLVPLLQQMGVLTRIDANALSRYCHMWSHWREAETFIANNGLMYPLKDDAGQPRCFQPWLQVSFANKLAQQLPGWNRSSG